MNNTNLLIEYKELISEIYDYHKIPHYMTSENTAEENLEIKRKWEIIWDRIAEIDCILKKSLEE